MKEYAAGGTDNSERFFGYRLCSARNVIENSFGQLKGRFMCLRRPMDIKIEDLPNIILTCFILHNFCELKREKFSEENVNSAVDHEWQIQPPATRSYSGKNE